MDTIRIYLENMFANFPKTEEVLRAKEELLSMMEDKFNELLAEGKPENEAVGVIISEFGNLEEIKQSLGLGSDAEGDGEYTEKVGRYVSIDEARDYIAEHAFSKFLLALGIGLCIVSVVPPIFSDELAKLFAINAVSKLVLAVALTAFFVLVAIGVGFIVLSNARRKEWKYLRVEPCYIDDMTKEYVKGELNAHQITKGITLALGIVLCSLSVLPVAVLEFLFKNEFITEGLAPSLLFILAGLGVFFIVSASAKTGACHRLLHLGEDLDSEDDEEDSKEIKRTTVDKNTGNIKIEKHTKDGKSIVVSIDNGKKDDKIMDNWEKETTRTVETMTGNKVEVVETVAGTASEGSREASPLMETILENFWFVVFIIFMLGGFVFHMWGRIWLIWIIAPIVHTYLKKAYGRK
ncbi:permease prefix domain 1-containing protein [Butyrivibrio sp. MC2021]|uniref:permease prefix domain 1-containing protein n=1 Tax=Butyrivibrio sp. MC2021 TaxID=1408306 RepID=UPI000479A871|nr:permease prefix domain 1-containing protein [Butyrivibrio sp. MC2021]